MQYTSQSRHNRETCRYLEEEGMRYTDWVITTLFYSALHVVNEYMFKLSDAVPIGHGRRNKMIEAKLPDIYKDYCKLQELGNRSRYDVESVKLTPEEKREALRCHKRIHDRVVDRLKY